MTVFVGTSGWQYRDWSGVLYPATAPRTSWLEEYAAAFSTVEINSTFYRLPERRTFAEWRARTPDDFVVSAKASRYLTHVRRLDRPEEPVRHFLDAAAGLGDRLGPVLVQLPPTLPVDAEALNHCLRCFPPRIRVAVEARDDSWWSPRVRAVLEACDAALCWADRGSREVTPLWRTASWGYLRFHGGATGLGYGRRTLLRWVDRIREGWPDGADVFVYFNNDAGGVAVRDAVAFAHAAEHAGLAVGRVPKLSRRVVRT